MTEHDVAMDWMREAERCAVLCQAAQDLGNTEDAQEYRERASSAMWKAHFWAS